MFPYALSVRQICESGWKKEGPMCGRTNPNIRNLPKLELEGRPIVLVVNSHEKNLIRFSKFLLI